MVVRRVGPERLLAAAIVAALHFALLGILLRGAVGPTRSSSEPPLLVTVFTLARHRRAMHPHQPGSVPAVRGLPWRRPARRLPIAQPITVPRSPEAHSRARNNWFRAMREEVRSFERGSAGPPQVRFGFPGTRPGPPPRHRFGWDYAVTHRIQELPTGGTLVVINDRCAIEFTPFPTVGCALGRMKTKGNLFEHMNEPRPQGPRSLP